MRILVVTQYFWPENFRINDLCGELVKKGHSVTVLTGEPNYPSGKKDERYINKPSEFNSFKGCEIIRVPLVARGEGSLRLALNYISYFSLASTVGLWKLRDKKFDVIFVCQLSPVTIALPAILYRSLYRVPIVMWVLDLWPDSLKAIGVVRSERILSLVKRLVLFIYNRSDLILGQSRSFVREIINSGTKSSVDYFPSWAENIFEDELLEKDKIFFSDDFFNILFAGNVGEAQDFPVVLKAFEIIRLRGLKARLHIVGDGRALDYVEKQVEDRELGNYIKLWGRHPLEDMPMFYAAADALFVSLKDSPAFSMTIPGKVQSYMMASKPVLALLNGEGADVINESRCGLVAPSGDYGAFTDQVEKMMHYSKSKRAEMGRNGRIYAAKEFNRDGLVSRLDKWFETVKVGAKK